MDYTETSSMEFTTMRVFVILYNIISKVLNHTIPSGVHLGLIGHGVVVTVGVVVISIETIGVVVSDSDVDSTFNND
jgi:hypothetical protein